ncbi:MAG: TetR/AcrR family transcriptional regulator [Oscillospiraceae bacterium]|nr:TetR/AcrR family transcriptional regulator [Oscillospiraceae bacterium]
MNRTKRKIFETSMELFAKKGYDATSIEEITAVVGVAKGTLYYHFSSKEEIFNFLVEQGMRLLKTSVDIKAAKTESSIEKLKEVILIQIKILIKYESFITIIASQMWGNEPRHIKCRENVFSYIDKIEEIVKEGQQRGELKERDSGLIAAEIFGLLCSNLSYRLRTNEDLDIARIKKEYEDIILDGLVK